MSKSKARKRYEFVTKVGVLTTQKHGLILGVRSYPGHPYDGSTLDDNLE